MKMELYYLNFSPPCRAVYATMKTLGLPVTLKVTNTLEGENRTEEFLKLNPAHQIPVLVDNGYILTESRAIMPYLVNQYSPNHALYPSDPKTRGKIDRMLFFEGTNFYPTFGAIHRARFYKKAEPSEEEDQRARDVINELVALKGGNRFLAGNQVSLADISLSMCYQYVDHLYPAETKPLAQWYKDVEAAVPAVKEINDEIDFAAFVAMLKK